MSKVFKATKKPVTIEALQWDKTGRNQREMAQFLPRDKRRLCYEGKGTGDCPELFIKTLEGEMHASVGDYIIKGVNGEFYPCKPDIFEKTYNF